MSTAELETQLYTLLEDAANKLSIEKFSINLDLSAQKGDGFLGILYKASIEDQKTKTKIYVVVKKAPTNKERRESTCIEIAYSNEIYFYTEVFPIFRKFQENRKMSQIFDNISPYITSSKNLCEEMIVLEDITRKGFQMREKDLVLDEDHAKLIFESYGRFHAISFCLRDQLPEEYNRIVDSIPANVVAEFGKKHGFSHAIQKIVEKSFAALDLQEDIDVCENFKKYTEDAVKIYNSAIDYKGKYSVLLHGDCWSNNIMFKYDDSKLIDIKLIDFQLIWSGTPVYDLSYFFYSGGSQKLYKNLEKYLDVYYSSFSKFAEELGSDSNKIFPRQALTDDWKKYSKFGMIMALLLTPVKLMSKDQAIEISESISDKNDSKFSKLNINENSFNQRVKDILNHMYEINAL